MGNVESTAKALHSIDSALEKVADWKLFLKENTMIPGVGIILAHIEKFESELNDTRDVLMDCTCLAKSVHRKIEKDMSMLEGKFNRLKEEIDLMNDKKNKLNGACQRLQERLKNLNTM